MKRIVSIFTNILLVASIFAPNFSRAEWVDFDAASKTNDAMNTILDRQDEIYSSIEERYGFNQDVWRSAKRKESAPRAEILFDNTNPKPGEKVTAHAIPEFFKNDPQNLYYTWYVIHTKDGSIRTATSTLRSGLIEASRVMARGDYDSDLDGQNYDDSGEDPDKDGWPPVDANSFDEDKIAAPVGGADGVGGLSEETVEDFSSASEYCDSLGGHSWSDCSFYDESGYRPLNTYYTPQTSQTNHYCNLCKDYFSGGGAASYDSAKSARNQCCYTNMTNEDCADGDGNPIKCPYDANIDYCTVTYNSLFDGCYDTFKESNKSTLNSCLDTEFSSCRTNWATVHEDTNGDGFSDINEEDTTEVSRCYKHNFGTNYNANIFRDNELSSSATDDMSGLDVSISCKHAWISATGYKSGSGKFPTGEEEKWKTDPTDPDTDGDGFPDEADVIGLGQQDFTWTYQAGDRVGVVVEGTSMIPTDEKNAYYKIMWGYLGVCDESKTGLMDDDKCDDSGDYGYGFFDTRAPGEETGQKLDISLSFAPDAPIADPSDENSANVGEDGTITDADQITVLSSLDSTDFNPQNLYYTWQISKSTDLASDDWTEVTNLPENFSIRAATSGLGLTNLVFVPKKSVLQDTGDIIYFKVTLTVSTAADVKGGRGRSSVIIPVNKNGLKITLYKAEIEDGKAIAGKEVCNEGLYRMLCPAVKNQMLAAKVTSKKHNVSDYEFSWRLNGEAFSAPLNYSGLFKDWSEAAIFFPITKDEQEIEDVSVTAIPKDENQPVVGGRMITVVQPTLFVRSSDTSLSWPVVFTVPKEDVKYAFEDIESENSFEAKPGSEVSYYLDFVPYYLIGDDYLYTQIEWSFNGSSLLTGDYGENPLLSEVKLENNDRTIKFPVSVEEGQNYALGAKIKKYWREEEKNILLSAWDITPETLNGETDVSITTKTPMITNGDETGMMRSKQILAAIGTNLPHYVMYLLRLVLTILVMFFVSAVFYGISQRIGFGKED
ncbi:MAG: hypothetical protein QMD77_04800 [Patescibacteria group bacterium]|nr:hypothetical protein [Patescibacteria group bacterium]